MTDDAAEIVRDALTSRLVFALKDAAAQPPCRPPACLMAGPRLAEIMATTMQPVN